MSWHLLRDQISIRVVLFGLFAAGALLFVVRWMRAVSRARSEGSARPSGVQVLIGFVTNFFDTLGIGSFATTTTAFKMLGLVPDERIPGTMLVGHTLPVIAQALIFVAIVRVEPVLLLSVIAVSMLGGWLGAGVVSRLPRRAVQVGMAVALVAAAGFMTMSQLGLFPAGGTALALSPPRFAVALGVNFVLGALITLGIGNYGPCLVLFSLLGMDPRAAFPMMMGAGALVALAAGARFMGSGRYSLPAALGLAAGGIPAVLLAGLVVKSLPLSALRWLVIAVVLYAAVLMGREKSEGRGRERRLEGGGRRAEGGG